MSRKEFTQAARTLNSRAMATQAKLGIKVLRKAKGKF